MARREHSMLVIIAYVVLFHFKFSAHFSYDLQHCEFARAAKDRSIEHKLGSLRETIDTIHKKMHFLPGVVLWFLSAFALMRIRQLRSSLCENVPILFTRGFVVV